MTSNKKYVCFLSYHFRLQKANCLKGFLRDEELNICFNWFWFIRNALLSPWGSQMPCLQTCGSGSDHSFSCDKVVGSFCISERCVTRMSHCAQVSVQQGNTAHSKGCDVSVMGDKNINTTIPFVPTCSKFKVFEPMRNQSAMCFYAHSGSCLHWNLEALSLPKTTVAA